MSVRTEREEREEALIAGLLQEPKRLVELKGFDRSWLHSRECRAIYAAMKQHYDENAAEGRVRFARAETVERVVKERYGKSTGDARIDKARRALRKGVASLLDKLREHPRVDEHAFLAALDGVSEAGLETKAKEVLLSLVDRYETGGVKNLHRALQEAASAVTPGGADAMARPVSETASNVLVTYGKAKKMEGGGYIPTPFPILNKLTNGGKRGRMWLVPGFAKDGKAQPLSARVLTPTGWKRMGDIKVGDEVVDPTGGTAKVSGVYPQGRVAAYRVTFSDGSSTECCLQHLWEVNTSTRQAAGCAPMVVNLKYMLEHKNRYFVPTIQPVDYECQWERPLDPYLMGLLLGDGTFRGDVRISTADRETLDAVRDLLPRGTEVSYRGGYDYGFRKSRSGAGPNSIVKAIRSMGLEDVGSDRKFVPESYKWAPVEVRLSVLQGLCDTDGYATRAGAVEYTTVSKTLASDVVFLARSLGCITRTTKRTTSFTYKGQKKLGKPSFRISISAPMSMPLFRLSRKLSAWYRPRTKPGRIRDPRTPKRGIVSIKYVGNKKQQCISLDSRSQLYVTDDFIVTHNTQLAKELVYHAATACGLGCVAFSGEQTAEEMETMLVVRHSHKFIEGGVSAIRLDAGKLKESEEQAMRETVRDLREGGYGPVRCVRASLGMSIADVRSSLEVISKRQPVDVVMLDHTALFGPSRRVGGDASDTARLSATLQEMKQLALDFQEKGVWLIAPHQIKREGYEKAQERGYYIATDAAGSAEAERSCDVMLWVLRTPELRDTSEVRLGIALDRRGPGHPKGWEEMERYEACAILPMAEENQ